MKFATSITNHIIEMLQLPCSILFFTTLVNNLFKITVKVKPLTSAPPAATINLVDPGQTTSASKAAISEFF